MDVPLLRLNRTTICFHDNPLHNSQTRQIPVSFCYADDRSTYCMPIRRLYQNTMGHRPTKINHGPNYLSRRTSTALPSCSPSLCPENERLFIRLMEDPYVERPTASPGIIITYTRSSITPALSARCVKLLQ